VFDVCRELLILTVENGVVEQRTSESIDGASPPLKIERLVDLGVDTLICGAITEALHQELVSREVEVLGFVAGEIEEVTQAYLTGGLPGPSLAMPGCSGSHGRFRLRRGRVRGRGRGNGRGRRRECARTGSKLPGQEEK
jgi:predicted Fe-Mo cluster-binding NifX family protein